MYAWAMLGSKGGGGAALEAEFWTTSGLAASSGSYIGYLVNRLECRGISYKYHNKHPEGIVLRHCKLLQWASVCMVHRLALRVF